MSCITGDETGVVKVWDISKHSGASLKLSFGTQHRSNGVVSMCWRDASTKEVCINRANGIVEVLNLQTGMLSCKKRLGPDAVTAVAGGFALVQSRLVVIQKDGKIRFTPVDLTHPTELPEDNEEAIYNEMIKEDASSFIYGRGPVGAAHIHRRLALAAVGGKENDLCIYDIASERQEPVFQAKNVKDHVLDVPMPVYIVGAAIVSSNVSVVTTAYHEVRFYDRRASSRPVQEFTIDREIDRRPTYLMQWNCNKFLIGEASGDVHLYDTRRGFSSRAKLRGGTGSVRHMAKHPSGHQLLAVTGLDRKARIFHVPTGKMLLSLYLKQRATCVLMDRELPMADDISSFSGITNTKKPEKSSALGDELWDDMDPVMDDFEERSKAPAEKRSREN